MNRTEYLREAKRRSRERQVAEGGVTITIRLERSQNEYLVAALHRQRGPVKNFVQRALLVGAAFLANAGNPRGRHIGAPPKSTPDVHKRGRK